MNLKSNPKSYVDAQIIGYTKEDGILGGENNHQEFKRRRVPKYSSGWAFVKWKTGKTNIYPIGYFDINSLVISLDGSSEI